MQPFPGRSRALARSLLGCLMLAANLIAAGTGVLHALAHAHSDGHAPASASVALDQAQDVYAAHPAELHRESVMQFRHAAIDLAFASPTAAPQATAWETRLIPAERPAVRPASRAPPPAPPSRAPPLA